MTSFLPRVVLPLVLAAVVIALMPRAPLAQSAPPIRIVLAGDSTVTDDSGWGAGFKRLATDKVEVINTAANGRSSKSFIDEGRWAEALAKRGHYYLIQFGHNDEPGKGPERETDPTTTYRANMARYVDDVRAIGATPILVTSLDSPSVQGRRHDSDDADAVRRGRPDSCGREEGGARRPARDQPG